MAITIHDQKKRIVCPVELALRILGGKWRGSIMYQLRLKSLGFNELKERVQDAVVFENLEDDHFLSGKVLSEHLAALQEYGLIEKTNGLNGTIHSIPLNGSTNHSGSKNSKYRLTSKGESAIPLLLDLFDWGESFY